MGLIRSWIKEMGNTWNGMAQGDAGSFIGLPKHSERIGTGRGPTPDGNVLPGTGYVSTPGGNVFGSGQVSTPDGNVLTEHQLQMLMGFLHQHYGRNPDNKSEFQQWLRDNW